MKKKPPSGSDRIVLSLVVVLGIIVLGVVVTIIIEALNPAEMSEIGQQVSVFFATVGGAIVGVAGGYVTHTAPQIPPTPQFPEVTDESKGEPTVVPGGVPVPQEDGEAAAVGVAESSDSALVDPLLDTETVSPYSSAAEANGVEPSVFEDVTAEFETEEEAA